MPANALPPAGLGVGIGLRAPHYRDFLEHRPKVDWLEIHSENYFEPGGWDSHVLERLRADYPIAMHGVGLGIGSARGFSERHIVRLCELARRIEPILISEHLCWGAIGDQHLNDLLPMPLTRAALELVCERVDCVQNALGRQILLENVSTYLRFRDDAMSEAEFLAELALRSGCGILLDINNLYVNQCNHGEDAQAAMHALAPPTIGEMHLAGYLRTADAVIDHHGDRVAPPVWSLYESALQRFGAVPTLIEWDTDIPALHVLLEEAQRAKDAVARCKPARKLADGAESLLAGQRTFAQVLLDSDAVPSALTMFKGDSNAIAQRLALYRGNLTGSWNKALVSAYPVLCALVGEEFFEGLAREYGHRHPSQSGDLNRFGEHFAVFLETFEHVSDYPYFPDMARLEWALHSAHYAEGGSTVLPQEFAALQPEQIDEVRLSLRPLCKLMRFEWAVGELWLAHQTEAEPALPGNIARSEYCIVTRAQWKAEAAVLTAAAFAALSALEQGETLGAAIDAGLAVDPDFDFPSHLQQWMRWAVFGSIAATVAELTG